MAAREGTWFFAYGSLMWAPGFEYEEQSLAVLSGHERDLCMMSVDHRGTRARPGLVAGLRPAAAGRVIGMAFRVAPDRSAEVEALLEVRENSPEPCYEARVENVLLFPDAVSAARYCDDSCADADIASGPPSPRHISLQTVPARVFFPLAHHWQYVPSLSDDDKVAILASDGRGRSGTSLEYLENLLASLSHHCGISDSRLRELLNKSKSALWQRSRIRSAGASGARTFESPPDSEAAHGGSSFTPIFGRSVIAFSHMNEDARPELQLIATLAGRRAAAAASASSAAAACASASPPSSPGRARHNSCSTSVGGGGLRVLCVASSGETALALASCPDVAEILAVDVDWWQIVLAELKRAATLQLDRHAQLRLLGMDPAHSRAADVPARLALYDSLRPHLPPAVVAALDSRREYEISFSLGHCGRSDIINHDLQEELAVIGATPWQVDRVDDLPRRADFCAAWARVYSLANFTRRFGTLHVGQPAMDAMVANHHKVLSRPEIQFSRENYFYSYFYTNYFVDLQHGLPLYLQERAQCRIRALGLQPPRLRFLHSGVVEAAAAACAGQLPDPSEPTSRRDGLPVTAEQITMPTALPALPQPLQTTVGTDGVSVAQASEPAVDRRFDLISISNICDWQTEDESAAMLRALAAALRPGGAIIMRHETLDAGFFERIVAASGGKLRMSPEVDGTLHRADRALLSRDIAAAWAV